MTSRKDCRSSSAVALRLRVVIFSAGSPALPDATHKQNERGGKGREDSDEDETVAAFEDRGVPPDVRRVIRARRHLRILGQMDVMAQSSARRGWEEQASRSMVPLELVWRCISHSWLTVS